VGVEHLARDPQIRGQTVAGAAVGRVADDGVAEMGEMDADLVGAAVSMRTRKSAARGPAASTS
jgi:hypothetical protein